MLMESQKVSVSTEMLLHWPNKIKWHYTCWSQSLEIHYLLPCFEKRTIHTWCMPLLITSSYTEDFSFVDIETDFLLAQEQAENDHISILRATVAFKLLALQKKNVHLIKFDDLMLRLRQFLNCPERSTFIYYIHIWLTDEYIYIYNLN